MNRRAFLKTTAAIAVTMSIPGEVSLWDARKLHEKVRLAVNTDVPCFRLAEIVNITRNDHGLSLSFEQLLCTRTTRVTGVQLVTVKFLVLHSRPIHPLCLVHGDVLTVQYDVPRWSGNC
jgi:hypothetical protein